MKKILVFAISLFRTFLLNFEKQFQEMNESKIKPTRAPLYSDPLSPAHLAVKPTETNRHSNIFTYINAYRVIQKGRDCKDDRKLLKYDDSKV